MLRPRRAGREGAPIGATVGRGNAKRFPLQVDSGPIGTLFADNKKEKSMGMPKARKNSSRFLFSPSPSLRKRIPMRIKREGLR
jgi:hypothetical protein